MPDWQQFDAVGSNVVIRLDRKMKTAAGSQIQIPDMIDEDRDSFEPSYGTVVAVGPGEVHPITKERTPPTVQIGDYVCYYGSRGGPVPGFPAVDLDRDVRWRVVKESDLFFVWHEDGRIDALGDFIIVKMDPPLEKSHGGILYADNSQPVANTGEVVAAGPGSPGANGDRLPLDVTPGDKVWLGDFDVKDESRRRDTFEVVRYVRAVGEPFLLRGEQYRRVREHDICGVVRMPPRKCESCDADAELVMCGHAFCNPCVEKLDGDDLLAMAEPQRAATRPADAPKDADYRSDYYGVEAVNV